MGSLATEPFREVRPGLFRVLAGKNAATYLDVLDSLEVQLVRRDEGIGTVFCHQEMNADLNTASPAALFHLAEADRSRLREALQELLARGSILGLESADGELYAWCRQNFHWLREAAALCGLAVGMEHESRLIQALPEQAELTLRLRRDATVVLLALWYEYDTQVRDHGMSQVRLTVEQLDQLLKEKLLPDLKSQPSPARMLEILRQAQRFNLVRLDLAAPFEQSRIEGLRTLPRVIRFNELAEWTKTADLHKNPQSVPGVDSEAPAGEEEAQT
jgi:hypothetical protein